MKLKPLTIVLSLALVAAFAVAARSQTPSTPQQSPQASAPSTDLPKTYLPGLGDFGHARGPVEALAGIVRVTLRRGVVVGPAEPIEDHARDGDVARVRDGPADDQVGPSGVARS